MFNYKNGNLIIIAMVCVRSVLIYMQIIVCYRINSDDWINNRMYFSSFHIWICQIIFIFEAKA